MLQLKKFLLTLIITSLLIGCAGRYNYKVQFNTLEPLRVAVLPFGFTNKEGKFIEPDDSLLIDKVGVVSSKLKDTPAEFIQNLVQNKLTDSSLDLVSPAIVSAQLSHRGFIKPGGKFDLARIFAANGTDICSELLSCDALLYGKVMRWDRSYYGIQSVSTIKFDLKLVSARDGKVLFESSSEDSESRGITKIPTGFSDLVLEPIKGLGNSIITSLAQDMITKALAPLDRKSRPEFLASPPPAIFASAHDVTDGIVSRKKPVTVLMLGSSKAIASFTIGDKIQNVPMIERTPGHYLGEFYPLSTDQFTDANVVVSLMDDFGRSTTQKIGVTKLNLPSS